MIKIDTFIRFIRLDHFTPFFMVLFPGIWCGLIYGDLLHLFHTFFLISFSILCLLIAGCIWNDFIDLKYDKQSKRACLRPLASGQLSLRYVFLCIPFFVLFLYSRIWFLSSTHIYFFIACALSLVYPFVKRFSNVPQIFLGMVNCTPMIVFLHTTDNLLPLFYSFPFYIIAIIWTILFDTIYAWNDREEDIKMKLGNIGNLITEKYMPLFIDLSWLSIWICFCTGLSFFTITPYILFVVFFCIGLVQRSRFVKGYLPGCNENICHPGVVGLIVSILLFL